MASEVTGQEFWDERYSSEDQLFSGEPNGALVAEAADLPPGQALDVGCGEGADALWLARRGWQVTAVDVSQVALERAARVAAGGPEVAWTRADLNTAAPPALAFDLVSVHYFPLVKQPGHAALRGLLASVAPGGTFLFVGHDMTDMPPEAAYGFEPSEFYQPHEIAELLDGDWTVLVDESRLRNPPSPGGHTHDTVLRAQRLR
ncbi:class I SAM-dependent methyltransferase [Saccharopolyspora elongata]|uniref:Class I SAM-dependent methyltransferase n=1 Tax=Saccharopolyspora elongata TaxID=2530387 RepID=A0A4R4Z9S2_9PSEU|nr:class I SAM-dependent methyltransferase [Saccharopolyspora elongata]TDD54746.1 class I SAM-dependent methyltransferase [Saccharopolyspora elongata]